MTFEEFIHQGANTAGISVRVIESVEEVYNKIQRIYNSTI